MPDINLSMKVTVVNRDDPPTESLFFFEHRSGPRCSAAELLLLEFVQGSRKEKGYDEKKNSNQGRLAKAFRIELCRLSSHLVADTLTVKVGKSRVIGSSMGRYSTRKNRQRVRVKAI